jgi:hypothetical protein
MITNKRILPGGVIEFLVFWIIGAMLTSCNHAQLPSKINTEQSTTNEEYAVFSAAIESIYVHDQTSLIAIENYTFPKSSLSEDWSKESQFVIQHLPMLSQEMLNDFQIKNSESRKLESSFVLSAKYFLVDEEESKGIYQSGNGWIDFYKRHPKTDGIIRLSRVGFNHGFNQALLYIRNQSSFNIGQGYYILLVKKHNAWVIENKYLWEVS